MLLMAGCAVLFLAQPVFADAGLPMIFLTYPAMLVALIPIIAVETALFAKGLGLGWKPAVWRVAVANVVSTVFGFPLTWFLEVILQMITGGGSAYGIDHFLGKVIAVTWQSPWLIPYSGENLEWMVPVAAIVGMIPAFFMSVVVEGSILKRLGISPAEKLRGLTWKANLASYGILIILLLLGLAYALLK